METAGRGPAASVQIVASEAAKNLREVRQQKKMSQRALAELAGVSEAVISHLETARKTLPRRETCRRIAEALGSDEVSLFPRADPRRELSLSGAKRRTGISYESLRWAIENGRLRARFGRCDGPVIGNPRRWTIDSADLDAFLSTLLPCRYPGCSRLGAGPNGCCSGPHAQGVEMCGKKRPGIGPKVSAALKGVKRGTYTPDHRAAIQAGLRRFYDDLDASASTRSVLRKSMLDPQHQFVAEMGRWGSKGTPYAKHAAAKLTGTLQRKRGGPPRKDELHERWLRMYECGRDAELEALVGDGGWSRIRAIAFLDWQRNPPDWPRARYPASRSDAESIDPRFLTTAKQRVEKGLQKARKKLAVR
jgi:transcriptional regulator with XRE-family HTH domain